MAKESIRVSLLGLPSSAQSSISKKNLIIRISLLSLAQSLTFRKSSIISLSGSNRSLTLRRDLIARVSLLSPFLNSSQSSKSILVVNNRE